MKLRVTLKAAKATVIAAAVMAFAFLFSACESYWFYPEVELGLTSVKIGDLEITTIPAPILGEDWDDEEYEVAGSDLGFVIVKKEADLQGQTVSAVPNVPTAIVTWGLAKGGSRPARFNDQRAPATFDKTDFFFFKVFDPDKDETKYYRFFPRDASIVKELSGLSVAGRDSDKIPTNVPDMDILAENSNELKFKGQVYITRKEALEGALVAATPKDVDARIRYAVAANTAQAIAGNFGDWVAAERVVVQDEQNKDITQGHYVMTFTDGNIIAVEVTAQNDEVNYYGFQVYTERMAAIADLKFDGVSVAGKGVQHAQWGDVAAGSFASADQNDITGFNVTIQLEDSEGWAEWGVLNTVGINNQPSYTRGLDLRQKFNHKQALAIKVHSPRDNAIDVRYYKIEVNLLAANFRRHPQSAAYEITSHTYPTTPVVVGQDKEDNNIIQNRILTTASGTRQLDKPIEPLSFELDRELTGTVSYQWYTANSWYGGYGFDQDNNIAFDPAVKTDGGNAAYDPVTNAILDKDYFPNPFAPDEKGNISLHNGGNQYYRLPYMGMPIAGATQATYTPTITAKNRPFITGFSNQTQYYWVVVTANGLKATSDRAAIVAEWGEEFNQGVPQPTTKVAKKHHIVDLHAYMDPNAAGLKGSPRNAAPFKAGNHGDQYLIPITFPAGFDIKDYKMVTCQAFFYLADGRPWIQNWTQGDFGFADANEQSLVLWYNVTNDNATRGLSGTGNDPTGSGLDEVPAFLIVKPAGTKPMKELPPFAGVDRDGRDRPAANNDAQGWFTPYIEIVELRFEGPAR
jgi:hypothetical protein